MRAALRERRAAAELPPASDGELIAALTGIVGRRRPGARIAGLERARAAYISSWWLEELTLRLDDGSSFALMFKDLGREAPGSGAVGIKPARLADPAREPWVYRTILRRHAVGAPELWGELSDRAKGRHWLFLEWVDGTPLREIGDPEVWSAVARWLGSFHAGVSVAAADADPLLRHDGLHHRWCLDRALAGARRAVRGSGRTSERAQRELDLLDRIAPAHRSAVEEALRLGSTLLHGEFYPGNVLVQRHADGVRVRPVDWEMAALGPPLLDLAAIVAGELAPDVREAMLLAYREGVRAAGGRCPEPEAFRRGVLACRLMLAIQWYGWHRGWEPPPEHRCDWLEEAAACAAELSA